MKELMDFIEREHERLDKHYGIPRDKMILARAVKVAEELGELCNDVLASASLQRTDKLAKHDKENIQEEFADVIFTTLLLAKAMGADIEKGLETKMKKVANRSY